MEFMDKQYILRKYKEWDIKFDEYWFNPNINPDLHIIKKCHQCTLDYENFRNRTDKCDRMDIEWKHPKACIWFDYFNDKIKEIIRKPNFVKKLKKK